MAWATADEAVARLWTNPARAVVVTLTGGEPLLEWGMVRRVIGHIQRSRPAATLVQTVLLTNGTLLNPDKIAFLVERDVGVRLSCDGVAPSQALRGEGTAALLDRVIDEMRTIGGTWFERRTSVSMTLVPSTIRHLAESVDYLMGKGVPEINVAPAVGPTLATWSDADGPGLDSQFESILSASIQHYRLTGRVPFTLFRRGRPGLAPLDDALCPVAAGTQITVDVDGQAFGCTAAPASFQRPQNVGLRRACEALHLGHIGDPALAQRRPAYRAALQSTGFFDQRGRKYSSYGTCRLCPLLKECTVCPIAIASHDGGPDPHRVPDFLCAFNQVVLKYRARFPAESDAASRVMELARGGPRGWPWDDLRAWTRAGTLSR